MQFKAFALYLEKLEKTSSRIEITKILAELFKKADKEEIDKIVYLSLGSLAPRYKGVVFNIAERMMLKIIAQAFKQSLPFQGKKDLGKIRELYRKKGDLGTVAGDLAIGKGKSLSVVRVYDELVKIAKDEGEKSQERKVKNTAKLLSALDPLSARFIVRIPVGNLRLGFSDKTILDALSWMSAGDKSQKADLDRAYFVLPDVGLLAKRVKDKGLKKATQRPMPVVGVPVLPMLAQRLKSPAEMIEKMVKVAVEPKFDGLRIQIHFKKEGFAPAESDRVKRDNHVRRGAVKAYTRNLNETSWMFPELASLEKNIHAREAILDTEAVGVDEERKKLANFQTTMTRRRKHSIAETALKTPIKFYVFDILYKDGKNLMELPYLRRRESLAKTVEDTKVFQVVDYQITKDPSLIVKEMLREVKEGLEGIMVKRADSRYVAGRTGWRWVKMKEAESKVSKLADTVDCVVMGYSAGRGKRVEFGLGQFLVGIRDSDEIKTVTKVGTGLTDEQFRQLKKRLSGLEVKEKPKNYIVNKLLEPDFWVVSEAVVEIAADEITKSPTHSSGLALRFPRLVRFRDDKSPAQATNLSELKKLYRLQRS